LLLQVKDDLTTDPLPMSTTFFKNLKLFYNRLFLNGLRYLSHKLEPQNQGRNRDTRTLLAHTLPLHT